MTDIAIINRTRRIRDARFAALLPALQVQVSIHFAPAWNADAALHFVGRRENPDPAHWKLWLRDNSDEPGDLGYHVDDTGIPEGFVFVEDDLRYGSEISVTISHELLEMLADPTIDRMGPTIGAAMFITEICDPVEADLDGYIEQGFRLSNFVLPAYFDPTARGPYDFRGLLQGPCPEIRPGGYLMYLENGVWISKMGRYEDGTLSPRATRKYGRSMRRAAA